MNNKLFSTGYSSPPLFVRSAEQGGMTSLPLHGKEVSFPTTIFSLYDQTRPDFFIFDEVWESTVIYLFYIVKILNIES